MKYTLTLIIFFLLSFDLQAGQIFRKQTKRTYTNKPQVVKKVNSVPTKINYDLLDNDENFAIIEKKKNYNLF